MRLVIGCTTLVVSVSAYGSYQVVRNLLLNNLKANALLEVQEGVDKIDRWLSNHKAALASSANNPIFRTMDWAQIEPYLRSEEQRLQQFTYFGMIDREGFLYTTMPGQPNGQISLKDRRHFQEAMAGINSLSDPLIARIPAGERVVAYAIPVWSGQPTEGMPLGPVIGAMNGVIKIDEIVGVVDEVRYGNSSYAFALNSKGEAIAHPNTEWMSTIEKPAISLLESEDLGLATISQRMVNRDEGIELVNIDGAHQYVAYIPLQETNWSVALVIPRRNIEAQLRPLDLMALVVLGLAATMIVVLWQVQSVEQAQLKRSKLAADSANEAKSEFLASMSHELRTPLNGILGYAQVLSRSQTWGDKERQGIDTIYQCGSHLLTLINDILDLAKIEARQLDLQPHPLHLPSFLQEVVEMICIRAEQKGIEFVYRPDPNLPEGVEADEKRLRQVLINLLGNAVKFTDQGTVTFEVKVIDPGETSPLPEQPSSSRIHFQIEDTGVGIAPDELEKIFRPFEQVGDDRKQAEGTGLGLAISNQIVSGMGSQLQVQSQLGAGSLFAFEVSLPPTTAWRQATRKILDLSITGYEGDRKTILVVDDQQENRSVLVDLLEPLGFQVVEAEEGQAGLETAAQIKPDLIITDLVMPSMDGYALLKHLRSSEDLQTIRVIVSSASVSPVDQQQSLDAGGDDFLPKPVQAEALFSLLKKHLNIEWEYHSTLPATTPTSRTDVKPDVKSDVKLDVKPDATMPDLSKMVIPPKEVLTRWLQLSQQGRLKTLKEEVYRLEQDDARYASFSQQILCWTKDFQADKVEQLIRLSLQEQDFLQEQDRDQYQEDQYQEDKYQEDQFQKDQFQENQHHYHQDYRD